MAENPFRVLLDLTCLQIETFKYVWINVSPRELKTIADFKSSILQKINLDRGDIKLSVRDGLLLNEETVLVLREDDTVKVQYDESFQSSAVDYSEKRNKKCAQKRNHSECSISYEITNSKKRKKENDVLNESPDRNSCEKDKAKKKKCKKSHNSIFEEKTIDQFENLGENVQGEILSCKKKRKKEPVLIESTVNQDANENYDAFFSFETENPATEQHETNIPSTTTVTAQTVKSNYKSNTVNNSLFDMQNYKNQQEKNKILNEASNVIAEVDMSEEVIDNCPKKKRKRRRKRKNADSSVSTVSINTDDISILVSEENNLEKHHKNSESAIFKFSGNTDSLEKSLSFKDKVEENVKRKHIIYPQETNKDLVILDNAKEVHNGSTNTFIVKDDLSVVDAPSFKDYPRVSTPNQSNGCDKPNWRVSLMKPGCSMKNNELEIHKKDISKNTVFKPLLKEDISCQSSRKNKLSPEMKYQDLPSLNSIPEIGTHIAYKTLELDESYSPTISEYKEGIVKNVNPDTDEIEIEFFVGVVKPGRTGKFENLKEDETPLPEVKTCDILKWSSILSPKHLS